MTMTRRSGLAGLSFYGLSFGLTVALLSPGISSATKRIAGVTCARPTTGAASYQDTGHTATAAPATVICPLELDETSQPMSVRTVWIDGYDNSSSTQVQTKVCLLFFDAQLLQCSATKGSGISHTGHFTIQYDNPVPPDPTELTGWHNEFGAPKSAFISVTYNASGDKMFGFTLLQ
jgi:hypothetical protein